MPKNNIRIVTMTDYSVGERLKLSERIRQAVDVRSELGHNIRIRTEEAFITITPNWENENIKPGTIVGASTAAVATVLDQYVLPVSSDTEIVDTEIVDNGVKYTVNVDSAFMNQARFKAMMEAGTGATSMIVDRFEYGDSGVLKTRPFRDTYQFEITVEDTDTDATRGPGFIRDALSD